MLRKDMNSPVPSPCLLSNRNRPDLGLHKTLLRMWPKTRGMTTPTTATTCSPCCWVLQKHLLLSNQTTDQLLLSSSSTIHFLCIIIYSPTPIFWFLCVAQKTLAIVLLYNDTWMKHSFWEQINTAYGSLNKNKTKSTYKAHLLTYFFFCSTWTNISQKRWFFSDVMPDWFWLRVVAVRLWVDSRGKTIAW